MKLTKKIDQCHALLGAAILVLLATPVKAVTIGIEGTGVDPNGVISPVPLPYNEAGFVLSNGIPAAESGIFGADTGGETNSGSDFFGWAFNGRIVLEDADADPFSFHAFDAGHIGAIGSLPAVLQLEVTGNLALGGSVVVNFNYTNPWQTFVLPETFVNLSSVEFLTSFDGDVGIDNLVLNERVTIPDSGTSLAFLALGLLGLVLYESAAMLKLQSRHASPQASSRH